MNLGYFTVPDMNGNRDEIEIATFGVQVGENVVLRLASNDSVFSAELILTPLVRETLARFFTAAEPFDFQPPNPR